MILHLLTSKIIAGYVVDQFETANKDNNCFYFIGSDLSDKEAFSADSGIRFILHKSKEYHKLINTLDSYDALILHSLHTSMFRFVQNAPSGLPIVWIFFGAEIYNSFRHFRKNALLPKTRKFARSTSDYYIEWFKPLYRKLIGRKTNESYIRDFLMRINYFALTQEKTYAYLRDQGMTGARFVEFSYYSMEESVGKELLDKRVGGDAILLGNSASLTNNHLDALELLSRNEITGLDIVVPLSYGESHLRERVKREGYQRFGDRFRPLEDFLPIAEYNKLMLDCGFVLMNHLRPQARGNIVTALWFGAKVFLNKENLLYQDFREKGLFVFPFSDIEEKKDKAFQRLPAEAIEHNRKILSELYSYEAVLKMTRNLVEILQRGKDHGTSAG